MENEHFDNLLEARKSRPHNGGSGFIVQRDIILATVMSLLFELFSDGLCVRRAFSFFDFLGSKCCTGVEIYGGARPLGRNYTSFLWLFSRVYLNGLVR